MSALGATAGTPPAESGRIVVATALPAPDDGLVRVCWPLTIWRLALDPEAHPWSARWRLRRRAPLAAVIGALLLLLALERGHAVQARAVARGQRPLLVGAELVDVDPALLADAAALEPVLPAGVQLLLEGVDLGGEVTRPNMVAG